MNLFLSFACSIIISIVLIPVLIKYATALRLVDQPNARKVHTVAIPRCGGIGLAAGAISAMSLFAPMQEEIFGLFIGGLIILTFGILDDRFDLHYKWKFLGQFLAVFAVMIGGVYIQYIPFNGLEVASLVFALPLTVFFVVGVINAVNLSDGLDGLAAGIMLLSFSAMVYLALEANGANGVKGAVVALAVAGGIVGFLWYNTHPAIVFMGDTGSQYIGFMAAFLSILLTQKINPALNPALPLLLLGLPILDTLTVMARRIRAGRSPFSPDKTHIHHKLMEYGFTHAEAVGCIYLIQGVFLGSAFAFRYSSDLIVIGIYLLISSTLLFLFYVASKTEWSLHPAYENKERRGWSLWRQNWLFQSCRCYINYALGLFVCSQLYCLRDRLYELSAENMIFIFTGFVFFILAPRKFKNIWIRFSLYISAIFADVMSDNFPEMAIHTHWIVDLFLVLLIAIVTIAIRVTRKSKFRLTTQDMLVVLFVFGGVLLIDVQYIEHMTLRLFCIVYALEYLLHREIYPFRFTCYSSSLAGLIILTLVFPTLNL